MWSVETDRVMAADGGSWTDGMRQVVAASDDKTLLITCYRTTASSAYTCTCGMHGTRKMRTQLYGHRS